MKKIILHGLVAGVLSAIAGIIYLEIYQTATMVDFSPILNTMAITSASILGCMLMAFGYMILNKFNKLKWKGILNILIILLTFLSILGPIGMTLPLDFDFPELFPGLAVPMHFFPATVFFGLQPFFISEQKR